MSFKLKKDVSIILSASSMKILTPCVVNVLCLGGPTKHKTLALLERIYDAPQAPWWIQL
jgi:hypothetical protein